MPTQIIVAARVQTEGKKLPPSESRVLGEFMRFILVNGVNPDSAASTARAKIHLLDDEDKKAGFGATHELVFSTKHRALYKYSGSIITITNLVPVKAAK